MKIKNFRGVLLLISMLGLSTLACGFFDFSGDGPPSDAVVIEVVANSSLEPWMLTAVSDFNAAAIENSNGDPYYVTYTIADAG
ncbi:MAG: hypothetical protein GY943_36520, partial [Chloroflexi bacterium]|nr:hypothetical protein [Chloroflexota bacterium]